MLGHEPAARERRRDLGVLGGEADVAHERLHQSDPRTRAIDRRDDRLGDRVREALRRALLRRALLIHAVVAKLLQALHVRARAEAPAGARHDDHAYLLGAAALGQAAEVLALHLGRPGV